MQYDRQIIISAAGNRRAAKWPAQTMMWSEFVQRLGTATRGKESLAEYLRMPKAQQDDLKDVGGFVGGELADGRRKGHAVLGRDLITLDMDAIPAMGTEDVLKAVEALGCAYAVYSTRKHEPARPRLRVILPTSRRMGSDEYEPAARKLAEFINMTWCDPTTFQAVRMMYWPSCCADSQHVYMYADKPFVDPDGLLALYADWRDTSLWPQVPGAQKAAQRLVSKQEDPTVKKGTVGAFCRVYNVYQAMDAFLPGVYEPVDTGDGRYTFMGGSTTGGAVVYDDGKFLYSHHATDPCGGQLVNAFDMVRLHLYGALDEGDEIKEGTPVSRYPSYLRMCETAIADEAVRQVLQQERYDHAVQDFWQPVADANWMGKLQVHARTGEVLKLRENVILVLQNDPQVKGRIGYDEFANRVVVLDALPWDTKWKGRRQWVDNDERMLRCHMEERYKFDSPGKIQDAVVAVSLSNRFDDLQDYVNSLVWDGVPRLDTLLVDYLNAENTEYTRAVTRKTFCAAIARAMEPGVKFDNSLIIVGKQGKGKSTLLRYMGKRWFLEDMPATLDDKTTERMQGHWLAEMGELNSLSRSEINVVKAFLSRTTDVYRVPYDKHPQELPRRCVVFGSTNDDEFLRDMTGNRRFWPVTLLDDPGRLNVFTDLPELVDQIWAEAKMRWQFGEPLYLTGKMAEEGIRKQEQYMVGNAKEGVIQEFLERPLPLDWKKKSLAARRMYWSGEYNANVETEVRRFVCAIEVWCECFGQDRGRVRQTDTREINDLLKRLGWNAAGVRWDSIYGSQRSFESLTVKCKDS